MKTLSILVLSLFALNLVACNTVHGFGKDLEKLGDQVQEKSKK